MKHYDYTISARTVPSVGRSDSAPNVPEQPIGDPEFDSDWIPGDRGYILDETNIAIDESENVIYLGGALTKDTNRFKKRAEFYGHVSENLLSQYPAIGAYLLRIGKNPLDPYEVRILPLEAWIFALRGIHGVPGSGILAQRDTLKTKN